MAPVSRGKTARTVTCVFFQPNGKEFCRVDFQGALFELIERHAAELNLSLDQFWTNVIVERCNRDIASAGGKGRAS